MNTAPNIRRILVAYDFSETTAYALSYARNIAEKFGARITVVHVTDADVFTYPDPLLANVDGTAETERVATEELERVVEKSRDAHVGDRRRPSARLGLEGDYDPRRRDPGRPHRHGNPRQAWNRTSGPGQRRRDRGPRIYVPGPDRPPSRYACDAGRDGRRRSRSPVVKMLSEGEVRDIHDWWRAANYLTVGQIYLLENALLRQRLAPEHIKPRLLGHWGTSPGLSLVYAHLNRIIRARDLNLVYLAGPGHGGPAMLANLWLEGTYSAVYPDGVPGRCRDAAPFSPVLHAGRCAEPRGTADARIDSRGWGARIRAHACLRGRVRQP